MKKFLCAVIFVISSFSFCHADVIPPYAALDNVSEIKGGNDYVYVSKNDGVNLDGSPVPDITITGHVRSAVPVKRGSIPTREIALLNPQDPVEITAKENIVTISDWGGDHVYSVRIFDSKGEVIEVDSEENTERKSQTIKLTSQPVDYYLEFMQRDTRNDDSDPEFCYVLLRMKAGHDPVINNSRTGNPMETIKDIYRRYRQEAENNPY